MVRLREGDVLMKAVAVEQTSEQLLYMVGDCRRQGLRVLMGAIASEGLDVAEVSEVVVIVTEGGLCSLLHPLVASRREICTLKTV